MLEGMCAAVFAVLCVTLSVPSHVPLAHKPLPLAAVARRVHRHLPLAYRLAETLERSASGRSRG